jgi:electron transfer flavoprotein alpha/beta subunit
VWDQFQAEYSLKEALGHGARGENETILLTDKKFGGSDSFVTFYILASKVINSELRKCKN